jgi:hypothetical protein
MLRLWPDALRYWTTARLNAHGYPPGLGTRTNDNLHHIAESVVENKERDLENVHQEVVEIATCEEHSYKSQEGWDRTQSDDTGTSRHSQRRGEAVICLERCCVGEGEKSRRVERWEKSNRFQRPRLILSSSCSREQGPMGTTRTRDVLGPCSRIQQVSLGKTRPPDTERPWHVLDQGNKRRRGGTSSSSPRRKGPGPDIWGGAKARISLPKHHLHCTRASVYE